MNKKFMNKVVAIVLSLLSISVVPVKADVEPYDTSIETYEEWTTEVFSDEGINVDAKSALLIEPKSGKILYEKNIDEKFAPASVTKIMTMLLTMEAVDSGKITLQDKVTCSENAKKMGGSTMLLDTGERRINKRCCHCIW